MNPSKEELRRGKRSSKSAHIVSVGVKEADARVETLGDVSTEGLPLKEDQKRGAISYVSKLELDVEDSR